MEIKLHITEKDLNKLKITKVKPWSIYFDYDDKHYMIHESGVGGRYSTSLYERIFDKFGNVLECRNIFCADNCLDIAKFIGNNFKYNSTHDSINITYNQINKFQFVDALYEYGFCDNYIHHNKLKCPKALNKDKKEVLKKFCGSVSYPISLNKIYEEYKYNNLDNESINKNNTELVKQFIYDCAMELTYHQKGLTDKQIADKLLKIFNILDNKDNKIFKTINPEIPTVTEDTLEKKVQEEYNKILKNIRRLK